MAINALDQKANNWFRPYGAGVTQHDPALATIVLYKKKENDKKKKDEEKTDYLKEFTKSIDSIESTDTNTGLLSPTADTKSIANINLDGSNEYYGVFNNFSLVGVNEQREQIVKVHNNFGGSWNAFFMGEKPKVYSFTGFFLDSKEYPYYQEFLMGYEKYLKARKVVERNYETVITYDGKVAKGYLINLNTTISGDQPYIKNFVFTVLVQKESWLRMNLNSVGTEASNYLDNKTRLKSLRKSEDISGMADKFLPSQLTLPVSARKNAK